MTEQVALRVAANLATADVSIDPGANPQVNPDTLPVRERTLISFRIVAGARGRYVFSTQPAPIVVNDGGEVFDPPVRRSDSWVTMLDRKSANGDFKYTINLVDTTTGQPFVIDPMIRNEQ